MPLSPTMSHKAQIINQGSMVGEQWVNQTTSCQNKGAIIKRQVIFPGGTVTNEGCVIEERVIVTGDPAPNITDDPRTVVKNTQYLSASDVRSRRTQIVIFD
jgi:hypothetical protein